MTTFDLTGNVLTVHLYWPWSSRVMSRICRFHSRTPGRMTVKRTSSTMRRSSYVNGMDASSSHATCTINQKPTVKILYLLTDKNARPRWLSLSYAALRVNSVHFLADLTWLFAVKCTFLKVLPCLCYSVASVVCLWRYVLWLNVRPRAKVAIGSL